jgi:6-carboxyhexanoate--CoA ligase
LWREIVEIASPPAPRVRVNGRETLMLASSNYLDLADDPRVKAAAIVAVENYGAGSGGARLTTGATPAQSELERELAALKHAESALLFNSGYHANIGVISAICNRDWTIFSDELNHASIIDGCRLSRAAIVVYRHNDLDDLRGKLLAWRGAGGKRGLLASDGTFSMDGDLVALPDWLALAAEFGLSTLVDEAHSTGVCGATGRGISEYFAAMPKYRERDLTPDIIVGTLSKSLASYGGFVAGSRLLIDYLRNTARSFIFSTMLPPAAIGAAQEALRILLAEPERVARLRRNVEFFCQRLGVPGSASAIVPLIVGNETEAMARAQRLFTEGYFSSAIRYPTVAKGQARLRVAISAGHSESDLAAAAQTIRALG